MFTSILVLSPFLFIFSFKQEHYHHFWKVARILSKILVYGMGFRLDFKAVENIEPDKSYMFCPNHSSLMDPFVLIAISKNPIVFVGKKELVKIPVFGFFYKRVVIMVDRSSAKSRKRVYKMAKKRLKNGVSMAIFPEGLVPAEDVVLAPFKKGAFGLAIEFKIPIVPQVYYDCKRFFSWDFLKGRPGVLRVHQHKFIKTENLKEEDLDTLQTQTFQLMYNDLLNDKEYMKDTNRKK
ncbi:1-acyl-sn-glycerol-3-phosphate acyltransferase [Polaribacter haliotis]|uniref:1-acyl-sn-glycerol-3-phosphate acyltransferase n=2 Tax=Polaribacter haliotis TaxID=1888915 RepID=A0A7L8ADE5_9FLAO|nr:lysophospholipid acyltransferase family protein [Polaribacter haliotis]QOD60026.1 1-acyl-sn-glycerol-3-phosphate acyltransferase [Polaribacter haliotis]